MNKKINIIINLRTNEDNLTVYELLKYFKKYNNDIEFNNFKNKYGFKDLIFDGNKLEALNNNYKYDKNIIYIKYSIYEFLSKFHIKKYNLHSYSIVRKIKEDYLNISKSEIDGLIEYIKYREDNLYIESYLPYRKSLFTNHQLSIDKYSCTSEVIKEYYRIKNNNNEYNVYTIDDHIEYILYNLSLNNYINSFIHSVRAPSYFKENCLSELNAEEIAMLINEKNKYNKLKYPKFINSRFEFIYMFRNFFISMFKELGIKTEFYYFSNQYEINKVGLSDTNNNPVHSYEIYFKPKNKKEYNKVINELLNIDKNFNIQYKYIKNKEYYIYKNSISLSDKVIHISNCYKIVSTYSEFINSYYYDYLIHNKSIIKKQKEEDINAIFIK